MIQGLPAPLSSHLLLLAERAQWATARVAATPDAALLVRAQPTGEVLFGLGDPVGVAELVEAEVLRRRSRGEPAALWLSVPRASVLTPSSLAVLGLFRASSWDWLAMRGPSSALSSQRTDQVRPLDLGDAEAIREVLRRANPISTADPGGEHERAWFGAWQGEQGRELVGVIGSRGQQGEDDGDPHAFSWHLHGLAVLPQARGRGLGTALTAAATAAGFAAGADWVSLGMYADNDSARRIYAHLGFAVHAEMASYGPIGANRSTR